MSKKTRHHFVPRFYLRGFEDQTNPGFLWVYNKDNGSIIKSPVSGTAVHSHYYSFATPAGVRDSESLENMFDVVEAKGAKVFRKILGHEPLTDKDQYYLVNFLAFAMTRVPNFRENMVDKPIGELMKRMQILMASNREHFEAHIKRFQEKTGQKVTIPVEELRQYVLKGEYDVRVGNPAYSLGHMLRAAEDLAPLFFNMRWAFLEASDAPFLTSDNPLYYMDPTYDGKSFWGVGLSNENIEVTFPLSKNIMLLGTWKGLEGYHKVNSVLVASLNKRVIIAAKTFVFAPFRSESLGKMVQEYKGSAPRMKVG